MKSLLIIINMTLLWLIVGLSIFCYNKLVNISYSQLEVSFLTGFFVLVFIFLPLFISHGKSGSLNEWIVCKFFWNTKDVSVTELLLLAVFLWLGNFLFIASAIILCSIPHCVMKFIPFIKYDSKCQS